MTKEVLLSLKGLQYESEEGGQELETITPAEYDRQGPNHVVNYEEMLEGYEEPVKNTITFRDGYLEVIKKGLVNVHMVFEANRKNLANYTTPYGEIMVGVDTGRMKIIEETERILLRVEYALDINYRHMADCTICVEIRPRGYAGFFKS